MREMKVVLTIAIIFKYDDSMIQVLFIFNNNINHLNTHVNCWHDKKNIVAHVVGNYLLD